VVGGGGGGGEGGLVDGSRKRCIIFVYYHHLKKAASGRKGNSTCTRKYSPCNPIQITRQSKAKYGAFHNFPFKNISKATPSVKFFHLCLE